MGMLFGGWYKETEEEVNDVFGGDWGRYKKHYDAIQQNLIDNPVPIKFSKSFPHVTVGDMICQWNSEKSQSENDFFVQRIIDGKIYGRYIDGRNDNMTEEYKRKEYRKLFSISEVI